MASFDPADPRFVADPYPAFAALRALGPVHEHPLLGTPVAVSHAACSAVLRGRDLGRIWADAEPPGTFPAFNLLHRNSLLEREGAAHDRLRALVAGAFDRGHTARLEPWVRALADRLVERVRRDDPRGRPGGPDGRGRRPAARRGDRGAARGARAGPVGAARVVHGHRRDVRAEPRRAAAAGRGTGGGGVRRGAGRDGRAPPHLGTPNPHLGFGAGVHYCLGAPLARLEVAAVLDALRTRLPGMAQAGEPTRRPDFVMRGLRELWLTA